MDRWGSSFVSMMEANGAWTHPEEQNAMLGSASVSRGFATASTSWPFDESKP